MAQILNQSDFWSSLGQGTGAGVASGLQQSLGKLAQHKLDTVLSRAGVPGEYKQQADELESLTNILGGRKDIAQTLMGIPANQRYGAVGNILSSGYLNQQAQQAQPGQQAQPAPQQGMPVRAQQQMPEAPRRTAADLLTQKNIPDTIRQALGKSQVPQQQQAAPMQQPQPEKAFPQMGAVAPQLPSQAPQVGQAPMSLGQATRQPPQSLGQALFQKPGASTIKDAETGPSDVVAQKETKDYYDKVSEESRAARNNEVRLRKLEKLIDKGKLNSPTFASGIKFLHLGGYGPDLGSWLNADTQEFNKLSTDFVKDAKQIFGSRLTDADLKTFLDTVPTVTQSDEAKRRVIKNMRVFNGAAQARKSAMDQVIEANGGRRPADLDSRVEQMVAPYIDQLANDFKENESQNKPFVGQLLKSLPEVSQYPVGTEIKDKKSGTVYVSDGSQWIKG